MKKTITLLLSICILFAMVGCKKDKPEPQERFEGDGYGVDLFSQIDQIASLQNNLISEQQSSYSRDGGNSDGFGIGNNVTGEPDGGGNPLMRVLLDVQQPGVVYRMWFTHFGEVPNLRIYIDGEKVIDDNLIALTSGQIKPFIKPLVQNQAESSGGFVFYVPIAFKKSIRIIGSGSTFYYNINYQKYPADTEIESFSTDLDLSRAVKILENVAKDPKYTGDYNHKSGTESLTQNQEVTIYESNQRQMVSAIELNVPTIEARTLDRTIISDTGRRLFNNQQMSFTMKTGSSAAHELRVRMVMESRFQTFRVLIDGQFVRDVTLRARRFDGFEWKDNPYWGDAIVSIPASATNGKTSVVVTIIATSEIAIYTTSMYRGQTQLDTLDWGNETSIKNHSATSQGSIARQSLEYDPNELIDDQTWEEIFNDEDYLNNIWINVYYDNSKTASVSAPISSFFGFGEFGAFETKSLMVGLKEDGTMYSYYPMPFEKAVKITLVNKNTTPLQAINYKVSYEENIYEVDSYGYFKTNYVVYEAGTSTALQRGTPMTFLNVEGSGHVVGVTHSMTGDYFGEHSRFYLEGDEQIYIDGQLSHSFHGTGTEDFYNGAWYFNNGVQVTPLYGVGAHNYRDNQNRTVMLRTLITDPIVFRNSIDFKMEHGGSNDRPDSNVNVLVYYYHSDKQQLELTDEFSFHDDTYLSKAYTNDSNSSMHNIASYYEGIYKQIPAEETKKVNVHTYSEFTLALNPDNEGAILRVLMDLQILDQTANVYVDGVLVGTWNNPFRAASGNFVRTNDYVIPKSFTAGKTKITIRIENNSSDPVKTPWTALAYQIYSIKK